MSESEQYTRLAFMLSLKDKNIHHHQMRFSLQGGCAGQQCRLDGLPTDKVYIEGSQPFCNEKTVSVIYIPQPDQIENPLFRSNEGHELQFATNHLGPFLLTNMLLPLLRAAPAAR